MSVAPNKFSVRVPMCGPREQPQVQPSQAGWGYSERSEMNRSVINLIAAAERSERGYVDVPPGSINGQIESELAVFGYAVAFSDRLWIGGYRVHTSESIKFGNYRLHVPPSIFTCASSQSAHVPDARDFDLEAVLEVRGEISAN